MSITLHPRSIRISLVLCFISLCVLHKKSFGQIPHPSEITSNGPRTSIPGQYVVVYKDQSAVNLRVRAVTSFRERNSMLRQEITATLQKHRLSQKPVMHVYETALKGFSVGGINAEELAILKNDEQIAYILPDYMISLDETSYSVTLPAALPPTECGVPAVTLNGVYNTQVATADFGPKIGTVSGEAQLFIDDNGSTSLACDPVTDDFTGKIAVIDRGDCYYSQKVYNAQLAGAVGVIMINNIEGPPVGMGAGPDNEPITIPTLMLSKTNGDALKNSLLAGVVNITMSFGFSDITQCTPWGITRVNGGASGIGKRAWILDSGIDLDHPDLNVNTTLSAHFIGTSPEDENGHGTHVAGTVAAIDNAMGVIGVAAGAEVVAVRVLNAAGSGSYSAIIAGVNYVAANAAAGDVANMSLGGESYQALEDAVLSLSSVCKVVVSAGNDARNTNFYAPSRLHGPNIYTVSAINPNDTFAGFSNFGTSVKYAAPGVNIASCWLGGNYNYLNGTSMAAPHITGLLLLGNLCITAKAINDPDGKADLIPVYASPENNTDLDNDGFTTCNGDPDDNDPTVYPGAPELCDNKDNNGDGQIDEGDICCPSGNPSILYVKRDAGGANNGLSWANAYHTLQDALQMAKKCSQITSIWVAKGVYTPTTDEFGVSSPGDPRTKTFVLPDNLAIFGGFEGNEAPDYDLSQRNFTENLTLLSGDYQSDGNYENNAYNVIRNYPDFGKAISNTAILDGFSIEHGYADDLTSDDLIYFPYGYGGGMLNNEASPTVRNCSFQYNFGYIGGGLFNSSGSTIIERSSFNYNISAYSGAGIFNEVSALTVSNSVFQLNKDLNTASPLRGGAIVNYYASAVLTNITVAGNDANGRGGIVNYNSGPVIRNSIIWGNGGDIYSEGSGSANLSHSIISSWNGNGSDNLFDDPMFIAQPDYITETMGNLDLLPCSPAMNTGDPATSSAQVGTLDVVNNVRVYGDRIDRGAYEVQSAPMVVSIAADPGLNITEGESVNLTATGADTYLWSDSHETTASIVVSPASTTTYTVEGSIAGSTSECKLTASAIISVDPLPVRLISFSAVAQPDNRVLIKWLTADEINNSYFEIERSTDLIHSEGIINIQAAAANHTLNNYHYTDEAPLKGRSYYRLKQVDTDGKITRYNWESVVLDQQYTVYPNPVTAGSFSVRLDESGKAGITLYNTEGIRLPLKVLSQQTNILQLTLPEGLPAGIYHLKVEERGQTMMHKIIVK